MQPKLYHKLAELGPAWQAALAAASADDVFAGRPWFDNLAETCLEPGERTLFLAAEGPGGAPAALLPCRVAGRRGRSLTNFYTCSFRPLLAPGADRAAAFAGLARAARLAGLARLDLDSLPVEEPDYLALRAAFRAQGFLSAPYFHFVNRYEEVAGSDAAGYLAARPTQLRNTLKRRRSALEREGGLEFELHAGPASLAEAMAAYDAVYAASWKEAEPYPRFTPGLLHAAAAAGWLRLGVARLGGAPAAVQLWLVAGRNATIFKLAYDERFKKLSVGTVLTAWMFERAFETPGLAVVDFGRNDDAYKRDWLPRRRERWGLLLLDPRRPAGLAEALRHLVLAPLARRLRRRAAAPN